MSKKYRNTKRGLVLILNILIFLTISLFIMLFVMGPITGNNESLNTLRDQKKEFIVAMGAVNEVLYRLNKDMSLPESFVFEVGSMEQGSVGVSLSGTSTERVGVFSFGEDGERELNVTFVENASTSVWGIGEWVE